VGPRPPLPCPRPVIDLEVAADQAIAACGGDAREAVECFNPNAAVRAEALFRKPGHVGAVAFSRTGDPATGDFGDATVIRKFGDVPDDLSTLSAARRSLSLVEVIVAHRSSAAYRGSQCRFKNE
jgi:hypothetical protein